MSVSSDLLGSILITNLDSLWVNALNEDDNGDVGTTYPLPPKMPNPIDALSEDSTPVGETNNRSHCLAGQTPTPLGILAPH